MKSLNLAVIVSSAVLLVSGAVHAEDAYTKNVHNQNLSKRPYQESPSASKTDDWEGATLVPEDSGAEKPAMSKHKQLRIHMLGRRPYIEDVR